ncbi:MAG: TetR/AcrR family transcriptional regulator [Aestuariivirga sp.]
MRYSPEHKSEARGKILQATGRGFRRHGFGGIGVDGLAKEAGVTSGAFYGHFPSKAEAFTAAAIAGLIELREGIEHLRQTEGDVWLDKFVDFYLSVRRTCEMGESCGLQSMTPDVIRSDNITKRAYQAELLKVVEAMTSDLPQQHMPLSQATAWAILAALSGGVSMARSINDKKVSDAIATSIKASISTLVTSS